jgi:hypothetical protein
LPEVIQTTGRPERQLRQLADIHRDPPRILASDQLGWGPVCGTNVRFGSKGDISVVLTYVCFSSESGHCGARLACIRPRTGNIAGAEAEIGRLQSLEDKLKGNDTYWANQAEVS